MHFDFTITLGQLGIIGVMIGAVVRFEVFMAWFLLEHDVLVEDFLERHPEMAKMMRSTRRKRPFTRG